MTLMVATEVGVLNIIVTAIITPCVLKWKEQFYVGPG